MLERILELLKEKNMTPSQFADEIGIQRSGMSHLISGRNKPSLEFILKVLKRFPDVKPEWLLHGTDITVQADTGTDAVLPKVPATIFDEPDQPENRQDDRNQRISKKKGAEKRVERIVVFYDDKTFREYEPER